MLEKVLEDEAIQSFLAEYSKSQWPHIVKRTLLYGIHSLQALNLAGFYPPVVAQLQGPIQGPASKREKSVIKQKVRTQNLDSKHSLRDTHLTARSKSKRRVTKPQVEARKPKKIKRTHSHCIGNNHPLACECVRSSPRDSQATEHDVSEEMKKFYQKEFCKLLPTPSQLQFFPCVAPQDSLHSSM